MKNVSRGLIITVFVFHISFVLGCMSTTSEKYPSRYRPAVDYDLSEVKTFVASMDKQFSTLGFKGIHLGMAHDQVNELVRKTPWGYMFRSSSGAIDTGKKRYDENWPDEPQYKLSNFLKGDKSRAGAVWAKIGCEGPKGEGGCYWIQTVSIRFFNGKLVEFDMSSSQWSADKINTMVKDWGKFALKGLIKKYGEPTKIYSSFDKISIFSFKSGYDNTLYGWKLGQEEIKITISEYESKFGCSIKFQNIEGVNRIRENQSKGITEF